MWLLVALDDSAAVQNFKMKMWSRIFKKSAVADEIPIGRFIVSSPAYMSEEIACFDMLVFSNIYAPRRCRNGALAVTGPPINQFTSSGAGGGEVSKLTDGG